MHDSFTLHAHNDDDDDDHIRKRQRAVLVAQGLPLRTTVNDDVDVAVSACKATPAAYRRTKSRRHRHDDYADGSTTDSDSDNDDNDSCSTSSLPSTMSTTSVSTIAASADRPLPMQSCFACKSTCSRGIRELTFDDHADVTEYIVDADMRHYARKSRLKLEQFSSAHRRLLDIRESDREYRQASAVLTATCLSHLHGRADDHRWPVLWADGQAHFYYPPASGIVSVALLTTSNLIANYKSVERDLAVSAIHDKWDEHVHLGDIPSDVERAARIAIPDNSPIMNDACIDIQLTHEASLESEQILSSGKMATMPCPELTGRPVRVRSWLMDSGASEDLICKRSVRAANRVSVVFA